MAKFWTPGTVKTRLGASIGMNKSARLHRLFVKTLCDQLSESSGRQVVSFAPSDSQAAFATELPTNWELAPQCDGDLGQRMCYWFSQSLKSSSSAHSILIGADCPLIDQSVIDEADQLLAKHDVVLGPAIDGGYYLIGLRGPWRDHYTTLFMDIPWSTETVLAATVDRANQAGLSCKQMTPREDIDTIDALNRLTESLQQSAQQASQNQPLHANLLQQINTILNEPESR